MRLGKEESHATKGSHEHTQPPPSIWVHYLLLYDQIESSPGYRSQISPLA